MNTVPSGKWLSRLRVERTGEYDPDGRALWRLRTDLIYRSVKHGTIRVPKGFITNYASVPRLPVMFLICGDISYEEAVVHDWLYTSHQVDRPVADDIFLEMLLLNPQVGAVRARAMWAAVRFGGGGSWDAASVVVQSRGTVDQYTTTYEAP